MILCDSSRPGDDGELYRVPYIEGTEGKRHGYRTKHDGVQWTRDLDHTADPRCPGCAERQAMRERTVTQLMTMEQMTTEAAWDLVNMSEDAGRVLNRLHRDKRTRRLNDLADLLERVGNDRWTRGDDAGSDLAWFRAGRVRAARYPRV